MTRRALELAARGQGQVSPSPLVGCVIVDANNRIVGEGTYIYENVTHAEVIALNQAGDKARNGTAYVSLEPHDHYGRTPPCTEALIAAGIRRVVCPVEDSNPLVSGNGFRHLRAAGIEVGVGLLRDAALKLNEKFEHWHKAKRPFVHLKMAMSLDGRIAARRNTSEWLTGAESLAQVHRLRHESDAILIGANTAVIDNPQLTDRSGLTRRRKLLRVVLDNNLRLPPDSILAQTAAEFPTLVFTGSDDAAKIKVLQQAGIEIVKIPNGARDLPAVLDELKQRDIQSVLVEGGAQIAGAFYDARLIDKVSFFLAPIIVGGANALFAVGGAGATQLSTAMQLKNVEVNQRGADFEITGYPNWPR